MRNGEKEIGIFAIFRTLCEQVGEVKNGLLMVFEMKGAYCLQIDGFEVVGISVSAFREDC